MMIKNSFKIENIEIGQNKSPFIIAEMSANHNQSLGRALDIVDAVADAGAHAIKLQTFTADTLTLDSNRSEFILRSNNSLWEGENLYSLYKKAYTPWEWHKEIFSRAKERGLVVFSTPFDETSVDFLESLDVSVYKIASFENNHFPLLKKVAQTKKPVLMSTGVATFEEIEEAVAVLKQNGCMNLVLMKCSSTYPAASKNTNLYSIPKLAQRFDCLVGLSDHTLGIGAAIASIALGARIIEKHFTLDREEGGVDAAFSLETNELKNLVVEAERAFQALGQETFQLSKHEELNRLYKRSIYVSKDVKKGDLLTSENIKVIRPSLGLHPKYFEEVLNKRVKENIKKGTPLSWSLLFET